MNDWTRAAWERRRQVQQRSHRPQQRRSGEDAGSRATVRAALARIDLRAAADDGGPLTFDGIASVTETPYTMHDFFGPYSEIVTAGAFEVTLARADLDVPLVLGHDQMRRIARTTAGTLQLAEIDEGLQALAQLDPTDGDVAYVAPKIRAGLIDEMSFAFRIDEGQWSPDYTEFRINRVDIHRGDVSIVGFGANPHTTANLRTDQISRRGMSYAAVLAYTA